ncbi:MAG: cytochrome c biosis protein [Thermomicrobiales bacterium]|nr:cytochrome c biosis protein [Thermomicrobiales bacterium]MEA2525542.1 cytochrome c biosis protein [Thermomicrobiales bacterium]
MAQVTATRPAAGRPPLEYVVDRIWRFFCSVRAAVYEIAILAVMTLLGTLRGSSVPNSIGEALPFLQPVIDRWYGYDFFHSFPFMFMLALVSVAIAICTLNRAPSIWKTIANPTVTTTHGFLNGADTSASFTSSQSTNALAASVVETLKSKRYRVLTETRGDEVHVYGDRNRFAKLGTFPFHLALIMILVGGIVGARYGFRENQFTIPEQSIREVGHGTGLSVELEQFSDSYRENATPDDYRSDLVIYKNGEEVKRGSIRVNHPMTYGSVIFYQSGFGQAVSLKITDAAGVPLFDDSIPLGEFHSTSNPDAPAGVQELPQVGYRLNVIGPNEAFDGRPEIDDIKLNPGEMYVQIVPIGPNAAATEIQGAVVGQGDTVTLGGINVQFLRERRFTSLQVARNPGVPIFWTASVLLVGGLAVTFYFPHRRVRAIVASNGGQPGSSLAKLAPLAKRDWSGQRDFFRCVDAIEARLETKPVVKGRPDSPTLAESAA